METEDIVLCYIWLPICLIVLLCTLGLATYLFHYYYKLKKSLTSENFEGYVKKYVLIQIVTLDIIMAIIISILNVIPSIATNVYGIIGIIENCILIIMALAVLYLLSQGIQSEYHKYFNILITLTLAFDIICRFLSLYWFIIEHDRKKTSAVILKWTIVSIVFEFMCYFSLITIVYCFQQRLRKSSSLVFRSLSFDQQANQLQSISKIEQILIYSIFFLIMYAIDYIVVIVNTTFKFYGYHTPWIFLATHIALYRLIIKYVQPKDVYIWSLLDYFTTYRTDETRYRMLSQPENL